MKQIIFSLILPLSLTLLACKTNKPSPDNEPEPPQELSYELVWSDEFETDGRPDPTKWTYERGFVRNNEDQWYQEENAFVENGMLIIEGRRETIPNPNYDPDKGDWRINRKEAQYTSASVKTEDLADWRFGRFEIRARIKAEDGLWPAFWMLGKGHEWPIGGEIDIMEYYRGNLLANVAWASATRWQPIWNSVKKPVASLGDAGWDEKFHIWRLDWTGTSLEIYLDDELLNSVPVNTTINQRGDISNPFQQTNQYMILNLAIGGNNGGDPSNTAFPSRYEIDYVRVYQQK